MATSLSLALTGDRQARTILQQLASDNKENGNFLEIWKNSDAPVDDPLIRSIACFRDKVLELERDGKLEISDLKKLVLDLQSSKNPEVGQYWRSFSLPTVGKAVKTSEISEAVREFFAQPDTTGSEYSGASEARGDQNSVLPLLLEIRNDLKAVKEMTSGNRKSGPASAGSVCSDVFASLNSCFMQ